jgi:putative hydrolase
MSVPGPFSAGGPFGFDLNALARLFTSDGPVNWELARQMAQWSIAGGQGEPNVDPLRRMRLEELLRVAELNVGSATGLETSTTGRPLTAAAVNRTEWALRTLDDYKPYLLRLAQAMTAPPDTDERVDAPDPLGQLLGNLPQIIAPMMHGMQAGTLVGQLASQAFGQYALPIPRPKRDELLVVVDALDTFAKDWSLPPDDVSLWVLLDEVAHHAVLGRPHVRDRLEGLLLDYAGGFVPDPETLQDKFEHFDPMNPASLQEAFADPGALLGALQTDAQRALLPRLEAVVVAVEGWVDRVMDTVGQRLVSSHAPLTEALRRRRAEETPSDRFVERIFGLELGEAQYTRGQRFVAGVVERAGEEGLGRLWESDRTLPTPAEIDAPGLWLARLEFD